MGYACGCFACKVAVTAPTGIAGEVREPVFSIMLGFYFFNVHVLILRELILFWVYCSDIIGGIVLRLWLWSSYIFWGAGRSAIPIGGSTLHRAAGIGIPQRPKDFNRMWHKPVRQKWRNLSVLIVDEISMVSAELLEYLEQTIRRIRTEKDHLPGKPFGGLQVWTSLGVRSWYTSRECRGHMSNVVPQIFSCRSFLQETFSNCNL